MCMQMLQVSAWDLSTLSKAYLHSHLQLPGLQVCFHCLHTASVRRGWHNSPFCVLQQLENVLQTVNDREHTDLESHEQIPLVVVYPAAHEVAVFYLWIKRPIWPLIKVVYVDWLHICCHDFPSVFVLGHCNTSAA